MTPRRILPVAALVAAILIPAATADAKAPSCTRGGAKLEQADGDIRIVSRVLKKTSRFQTRKEGISACWVPTGKRIRIATEIDHGEDLLTSTSISILEGRYVGVNILYLGGISERTRALVFDAKKQAKLHDTKICEPDTDDHTGPEDVEFLQKGGMVFICGALWMFRDAAQKTPTMLEPASALPVALAASRRSMSYVDVIYWTTLDDGTANSLGLVE